MSTNLTQLLIPIFAMVVNVLVHILGYRYLLRGALLKSLLVGFASGFLMITFCESYLFLHGDAGLWETFPLLLVNQAIYFSLWYCYFNFVNMGETARRVRLMRELIEQTEGLTYDELLQKYNAQEMVKRRIGRLLSKSQIIEKDGRFYSGKPTVLFIAKVVIFMKLFVLGKKSEYE